MRSINERRKGARYYYLCGFYPKNYVVVKRLGYKKYRRVLWNLGNRFVWSGFGNLEKRIHCQYPWIPVFIYKEWQKRYVR